MLYRLFTENKNYEQVKNLIREIFVSATIIKAEGLWQGESEHSLIIEVLADDKCEQQIRQLCYNIKKLNQQDKILVQRIESDSKLV